MPIMTANAQRSSQVKVAREIADKVPRKHSIAASIHILAVRRNRRLLLPDSIGITSVSTADLNVLEDIADDMHNTSVYEDKSYVINELMSITPL